MGWAGRQRTVTTSGRPWDRKRLAHATAYK